VLVLDAAPQPLGEELVEYSSPSFLADGGPCTVQEVREGLAGEPRALVAVEDLRLAVSAQSVLQAIDTEHRFQDVADPSIEGFAARRVADRHQVGEATRQPDVDSAR
jgi:hypothetical protein